MSQATVVHVKAIQPQSKDESERIVDTFLSQTELPSNVKAQIERIQRDLQGLPPQIPEPVQQ